MGQEEFRHETMIAAPAGVAAPRTIYESEDGILLAYGITVPGAVAGYAIGCIFIHTDGTAGTTLYANEGTAAVADFDAITVA